MRLLAHPTRLDERRQPFQRRVGRQVGEIVLALARRAVLADQPDLVAGQMLARPPLQTNLRPIGDPHPHNSELGPQGTLGTVPPMGCRLLRSPGPISPAT